MKSIKNQYIALKEGKMTEAQFMRNIRMTLPEYISNVTLFKQAEKILINKGIISEIKESLNEVQESSAVGYYNQNGKEQYGKFDELDNMNAQEIMAGYVLEKIDNPDKDKKEIVKLVIKNLKKDQFYYTNYKLTGIPGGKPVEFTSTKRKPGFDQMEELDKKSTNLTDEKNKMQVVKEGLEENTIDEKLTDINSLSQTIYDELMDVHGGAFDSQDLESLLNYYGLDEEDKDEVRAYIFDRNREDEDFLEESTNSLDEATKAKLKKAVIKVMKEMFDGRDNMTDVTGENN